MSFDLVTIVIIAVTVLISFKGFEDFSFFEKYKFQVGAIQRGEQIRMLSSGFLHGDQQHLFFNMLTLFFFAPFVNVYLGEVNFLIIYFSSMIAGSLLSLFFHKNEYHYSAIGASGAVTGILFAAILLQPHMKINFFIPGYLFGIIYLGYSIYGMKNRVGNIGHDAHLGGAICGYVFVLLMRPQTFEEYPLIVAGMAIPIIALFVLLRTGRI